MKLKKSSTKSSDVYSWIGCHAFWSVTSTQIYDQGDQGFN